MIIEGASLTYNSVKVKIAIIRRLRQIDPHKGNTKVVNQFGHHCYEYRLSTLSEQDVTPDVIPHWALERKIVIVPDLHDITLRYSIQKLIHDIDDTL